nr:IS30 family transposase [Cryobacterium sp. TMT2-14]
MTRYLRTGRPLRKRRRRPNVRAPRFIAPATLIDHHPQVANERARFGYWEGDLIIGTRTRSAIGTLVDRKSGYTVFLHFPGGHTAAEVNASLITAMSALPQELQRTLTWDQGAEMASNDKIASLFTDGMFFAHAGKPWQRGSNENMSGLLRQYFPKHTDLAIHSADDLAAVATKISNRPRKRLGWTTPAQLLADVLRSK